MLAVVGALGRPWGPENGNSTWFCAMGGLKRFAHDGPMCPAADTFDASVGFSQRGACNFIYAGGGVLSAERCGGRMHQHERLDVLSYVGCCGCAWSALGS